MGLVSILCRIVDFQAKQWIKDIIKCCHWARKTNIGLLYLKVRNKGDIYIDVPQPKYWTGCEPGIPAGLTPVLFTQPNLHSYTRQSRSSNVKFWDLLWQYFLQAKCPSKHWWAISTRTNDNNYNLKNTTVKLHCLMILANRNVSQLLTVTASL